MATKHSIEEEKLQSLLSFSFNLNFDHLKTTVKSFYDLHNGHTTEIEELKKLIESLMKQ